MAGKPERDKETFARQRSAHEKRCTKSNSWIVKRLRHIDFYNTDEEEHF